MKHYHLDRTTLPNSLVVAPSARKISLHPVHPVLLKVSGDRNEGQNSKNANLPKRVSCLNNIIFKEFIFKK